MIWWWRSFLALIAALWLPSVGWSILVVDPSLPITHRVNVRLIETALSDGTSPATMLGDPVQRAEIEASVDAIWAQAGIDVNFLPTPVRYNNTFVYQGNLAPETVRPIGDLTLIMNAAEKSGFVLHPDDSVINLFMVEVVPGFGARGDNWGGGLANVGTNGITIGVGENLLLNSGGRESVAMLLAHEIGHNLGLRHNTDTRSNLMAANRTSAQLTPAQIEAIFQWRFRNDNVASIPQGSTGFVELIPGLLAGDYTRNGVVDGADYTLWRNTLGSTTQLAADGNGNSSVDAGDYNVWKVNFGNSILPPDLPGDYNGDKVVDAADYSVWRNSLGSRTSLAADGNRNLLVDEADYNVWKSNFGLSLLPQPLAGDYNRDGAVNAADYSVWRNTLGSTSKLAADGNGNRIVDENDYAIWKSNFGATSANGGGATLAHSVPEPASLAAVAIAGILLALGRTKRCDKR